MAPIAAGFVLSIGTAAFLGIFVGAIAGALVWRLRTNTWVGCLLTMFAFIPLLLLENNGRMVFLKAELVWGTPALMLAFLLVSILASCLASRMTVRPTWIALIALLLTWGLGFLYMFLFRVSFTAPPLVALGADACLLLLLVWNRRAIRMSPDVPATE